MSQTVETACSACGLKVCLAVGGTMANFKDVRWFPAACDTCRTVVEVNALAETPRCPECGSNNVSQFNKAVGDEVARAFSHILYRGPHDCPACNERSLTFVTGCPSKGILFQLSD